MKPEPMQPREGEFNFAAADAFVKFGLENKMFAEIVIGGEGINTFQRGPMLVVAIAIPATEELEILKDGRAQL